MQQYLHNQQLHTAHISRSFRVSPTALATLIYCLFLEPQLILRVFEDDRDEGMHRAVGTDH